MRVFLDASVLIRAVERPKSDSAAVVDRVLAGGVVGVVDELVLEEVERFFREKRGRHFAWLYTEQLRRNTMVVSHADAKAFEAPLSTKLGPSARLHRGAARSAEVHAVVNDPEATPGEGDQMQEGVYTFKDFTRSVMISIFVGTILVLLNVRPPAPGEAPDFLRVVFNYLVPFSVASVSAMFANHARITAAGR